jgi:hypothetical protein
MNGSIIDELKVVISADYSSLKVSLDQGINALKDFMSEANSGQIDWVNILQGTFTPALIATIASSFALAIENALQFQSQVAGMNAQLSNTEGGATDTSTAVGTLGSLVDSTGQSSADLASTYAVMLQQFNGNTQAAQQVTTALGQLAEMGIAPLSTLTQQATSIFQAWNVTTGSEAVSALNGMYQAAQSGNLSWADMTSNLEDVGGELRTTNTSISATASAMQALSKTPGATPADVASDFQAIASAASNGANPLNGLHTAFGNINTDINKGGLNQALIDLQQDLSGSATQAQALALAIGIPPAAVTQLNLLHTTQFKNILSDQEAIIDNNKTIIAGFAQYQATAPTTGLWNKITAGLGEAGTSLMDLLTNPGQFYKNIVTPGTAENETGLNIGSVTSASASGLLTGLAGLGNLLTLGTAGLLGNALGGLNSTYSNPGGPTTPSAQALGSAVNYYINIPANSSAAQTFQKGASQLNATTSSSMLPSTQ